jgi:hypothetical protein
MNRLKFGFFLLPLILLACVATQRTWQPPVDGWDRARYLMGWVDRWKLELQEAVADPMDPEEIRSLLHRIADHVDQLGELHLYDQPEAVRAFDAELQKTRERLAELIDAEWNPTTRLTLSRLLSESCKDCHVNVLNNVNFEMVDYPHPSPELMERVSVPSAQSCGTCHPDHLKEWQGTLHATAWTDPVFRAAFGKREPHRSCRACHSTMPILMEEISEDYGYRPRFRDANHEDSISCLSCHGLHGNKVAARRTVDAPCNPTRDDRLLTPQFCGACHNPTHSANYEWQTSQAFREGKDCNSCHTQQVVRTMSDGTTRMGLSHAWKGGNDPEFVKSAVNTDCRIENGTILLTLENLTSHKFPGEVPSRTVLIRIKAFDKDGNQVHDGGSDIRRPLKSNVGRSDNRLLPDETRTLTFDVDPAWVRTTVGVYWQPTLLTLEHGWVPLGEWEFGGE